MGGGTLKITARREDWAGGEVTSALVAAGTKGALAVAAVIAGAFAFKALSGGDDAPETELEVSYAAETADASGFRNGGVFLVSDPLAGPAPLGSPTPKR